MIESFNNTRIGFIGAGKVGNSLGKYLVESFADNASENGEMILSGYFSRSASSAQEAADFTDSKCFKAIEEIIDNSDIIFVTVPDGIISSVWDEITDQYKNCPFEKEKLFCHCSGSLTSEIFSSPETINALTCSFHPIFAVSDKHNAYKELHKAFFTVEGSDSAYSYMNGLIDAMKNQVSRIDASKKTLYHIACVFFSNLVVGLAKDGEEILRLCGLEDEFAKNAWKALFLDNAINISNKGPELALTGPAERGDSGTISSHIEALRNSIEGGACSLNNNQESLGNEQLSLHDEQGETDNNDILRTYCLLTKSIVKIAKTRHPERDYSEIESILD